MQLSRRDISVAESCERKLHVQVARVLTFSQAMQSTLADHCQSYVIEIVGQSMLTTACGKSSCTRLFNRLRHACGELVPASFVWLGEVCQRIFSKSWKDDYWQVQDWWVRCVMVAGSWCQPALYGLVRCADGSWSTSASGHWPDPHALFTTDCATRHQM